MGTDGSISMAARATWSMYAPHGRRTQGAEAGGDGDEAARQKTSVRAGTDARERAWEGGEKEREGEREGHRGRGRERERERTRENETETERQRDRETGRKIEREIERKRERDRE